MKNFVASKLRPKFTYKMFLNVFAEELTTPPTEPTKVEGEPVATTTEPKAQGTVNFEDLISKARTEERGKLYPQIEKLKADKNNLLLVVGERDTELANLKTQLADLETNSKQLAKDLKDGTKTNTKVSELTLTISTLERQLEDLQVKYESDVNSLKLTSYKEKKIAEASGELIPELVTGDTEEEINASIETAKTRYAEITQRAVQGVQLPPANPSASTLQIGKELTFEQMQSMSTADWAKARAEMGLK